MPQDQKPAPPAPDPPPKEESELLDTGQEEVFSRTEVELGRIEHNSGAAGKAEGH